MENKSIIIIGAGIAGLSAGCYGRMNNYHTRIFEMHTGPGGVCTAWKRKGYTIDGCLHWLVGSKPGTPFYRFWEELGAVQGRSIIDHEEYMRVEGKNGNVFIIYTDLDRLEQHMKDLAPEDKDVIEVFIKAVHAVGRFEIPIDKPPELYGPFGALKLMFTSFPFLRFMKKWGRISVQDFAKRFKNPFLREVFHLPFDLPDFPMIAVLMTLNWMHQKNAGYLLGGSLEFARSIERRYLGLGGEIHYRSPVIKILVERDQAVGVRLADGSEHRGDFVVSAADGHATIFDMLDGQYINNRIRGYYERFPIFFPLTYIALGVARPFENLPPSVSGTIYPLDEPVTIDGKERHYIGVQVYNFDPSLAPEDKSVLRVMFNSDYERWKGLKQDPDRYQAEKEQLANKVTDLLDKRFPGLAPQVEMCDVATPMTWERYTGNWQGSFEGWLITTKTFGKRMRKTLPGLKNFYMAGQWVEPGGGLPTAAMSGRHALQMICKKDRESFITTVP